MDHSYQIGDWVRLTPEARQLVSQTFAKESELLRFFLSPMQIVSFGSGGPHFLYPPLKTNFASYREGGDFFWNFKQLELATSCRCELKMLMNRGCRCGAPIKE